MLDDQAVQSKYLEEEVGVVVYQIRPVSSVSPSLLDQAL